MAKATLRNSTLIAGCIEAAGVYKGRPASIDAAQVRAKGAQDRPGVGLSGLGSQLIEAAATGGTLS
jgi:hypothetical protein